MRAYRGLRGLALAVPVAFAMAGSVSARLPMPYEGIYKLHGVGECRVYHSEIGWIAFCRGYANGRSYDLGAKNGMITSFSYKGPGGVKHFAVAQKPRMDGEVTPDNAETVKAKTFMEKIIQSQNHVRPFEKPKLRIGKPKIIVA